MLTIGDLVRAVRSFRSGPDAQQQQAVNAPASAGLFIVAGPGTGKTASLTLRILKLVLVDGVPPSGILATTFTKKAAEELRSRILGWGFKVIDFLSQDPSLSAQQKAFIASVDINQVQTGTLDSVCERLLREFRAPGTQSPVLVDEFVSDTLMLREGLFGSRRDLDAGLDTFLMPLHSSSGSRYRYHAGAKAKIIMEMWERRFQDQVAWSLFPTGGPAADRPARKLVDDAHYAYKTALNAAGLVDFSTLEDEVLKRLRNGHLKEFTSGLNVILVDEYQDTNLLQEQLYFELAVACGGALAVVGDDDQSLYRFRGATVDLFRDFATRYQQRFGRRPMTVFLTTNYRSTKAIVSFVNGYATLDRDYQAVRVAHPAGGGASKPPLTCPLGAAPGFNVFGMFRDTVEELGEALAELVHSVFRGAGYAVPGGTLICAPNGGDVGDCAVLCSSPAEVSASGKPRLPLLLREELLARAPSISVFNPRGEDIATIETVERFGGLLLECLDPGGFLESQTNGIYLDRVTKQNPVFTRWRQQAIDFANGPGAPVGLLAYAQGWASRQPGRPSVQWPDTTTAIQLVYGLVHYLPELHDDPEGQVYLELFMRQLGACQQLGKFDGRIIYDPANQALADASVKELLRDFLAPIAEGVVDVDEELMQTFPRDRLSIISIHQSKGLEFPLTIVDVGSDFNDLKAPAFKRMPTGGDTGHRMEDLLRPYSPLGVPPRSQQDRAFDDLYRKYFVAFSRPQDVLLLVGVTPTQPGGRVPNVATGWDRHGVCHWDPRMPFEMI
jgi:DNA helicase II / ATP-dependent DNA helicase PcrA